MIKNRKFKPLSLRSGQNYALMQEFYEDKLDDLQEELKRVQAYITQIKVHNREVAYHGKETKQTF